MYTNVQKDENNFFYVFERRLFCSPRLHLFDQKYSKNRNVKYYYNLK